AARLQLGSVVRAEHRATRAACLLRAAAERRRRGAAGDAAAGAARPGRRRASLRSRPAAWLRGAIAARPCLPAWARPSARARARLRPAPRGARSRRAPAAALEADPQPGHERAADVERLGRRDDALRALWIRSGEELLGGEIRHVLDAGARRREPALPREA